MTLGGYRVRSLEAGDEADVVALFGTGADYFELIEGAPPGPAEFQHLVTELPPGKGLEDKFVYGVFRETGPLVAVIDLIRDYPRTGIWFIGLVFIARDCRRQGLGTAVFKSIRRHVTGKGGSALRIAVAEKNADAMSFWMKSGFSTLSTVERDRSPLDPLLIHVMERAA